MSRKIISLLLVLVLTIFTFSGCGSKSNTDTASTNEQNTAATVENTAENSTGAEQTASGDTIEIRFAWWGDTARNDVYNAICDRFEEANPGIKVVREPSSWNDYFDKLATQAAGNNAPDVFGMHVQYVSDYAGRGALAEIQSYVDNGIIDTSKMSEAVVNSGKFGDKLYMIPQGVTFTNQLVNATLLEKYGIEVPKYDTDQTWDEFKALGEQLVSKAKDAGEEAYISSDMSTQFTMFRYMARQAGGDLYTADGKLNFTQDTVEQWFTYWKTLRDEGLIPDASSSTEDATAPVEQKFFTKGAVAFTCTPANQLHLYQQQMPDFELTIARNPVGNDGARGEYLEGAHFAISSASDDAKKEAAAKLINFFVNTQESMELFKMEQGVPANSDMAEYIKTLLDETMTKEIDYVNATIPVAGEGTYAPVGATEINTAFSDAAAGVQFGEVSPADAAKQFMEAAQTVLDSSN